VGVGRRPLQLRLRSRQGADPEPDADRKSDLEGPLYLARSAYRPEPEPATLDPELLARTEDRYAGIREGAVQELAELSRSRDPSVSLAARHALSEMLGDDSRRVSTGAQAALDAAERAEAEHAEPERPVDAQPVRRRHRLALAIALAAVAIAAAVTVVVLTDDRTPSSPSTPDVRLAQVLPASVPPSKCRLARTPTDNWMKETKPAPDVQYACDQPADPDVYLGYGVFSTADAARRWTIQQTQPDPKTRPCDATTTAQMRAALPAGRSQCYDVFKGDSKGVNMWWNADRSTVVGWLGFGIHDQAAALQTYRKTVKAHG
jgi:hypothetical protein